MDSPNMLRAQVFPWTRLLCWKKPTGMNVCNCLFQVKTMLGIATCRCNQTLIWNLRSWEQMLKTVVHYGAIRQLLLAPLIRRRPDTCHDGIIHMPTSETLEIATARQIIRCSAPPKLT